MPVQTVWEVLPSGERVQVENDELDLPVDVDANGDEIDDRPGIDGVLMGRLMRRFEQATELWEVPVILQVARALCAERPDVFAFFQEDAERARRRIASAALTAPLG